MAYTKLLLLPGIFIKNIVWLLIYTKHATIIDVSYWLGSIYYMSGNMLSTFAHQFIYFLQEHYMWVELCPPKNVGDLTQYL